MTGRDWHFLALGFQLAAVTGIWVATGYYAATCRGQGCLGVSLTIYVAIGMTALPVLHVACWYAWTRWRKGRTAAKRHGGGT